MAVNGNGDGDGDGEGEFENGEVEVWVTSECVYSLSVLVLSSAWVGLLVMID